MSALLTGPGAIKDRAIDGQPVVAIGARSGLWYTNIVSRWADAMESIELSSFPTADPRDLCDAEELRAMADDFPEGGFAGFNGDEMVAMGIGIRTHFDLDNPHHTVHDIVDVDGNVSGHVTDGPWYYGITIAVRSDHRRRGIGRELYELRKTVCRDLDLNGIVAGGVMPGYADHLDSMSADDYIASVRAGELYDPTLSFQAANGFELGPALAGYITDPAVNNYSALIVWHNPGQRD